MHTFKNIVLTTDFSLNASAALPYAVALAKPHNGTIHLFHVIEHEDFAAFSTFGNLFRSSSWITNRRDECQQKLTALAKDFEATYGVKFVGIWAAGNPVKEIVHYAREAYADIVVISTHGRTGLPHLMLGSIAERVTRLSDVPVLTIRPGEPLPDNSCHFSTILLPTDFSQNAIAAEPYAMELAKQRGGKILLANVIDDSIFYASEADPTSAGVAAIEDWVKTLRIESDINLKERAEFLARESGLVVEPVQLVGRVTNMLFTLIHERQVDLVVMSTHGFTGLSRLMLGSIAEDVVQTSTVPVLSVKPAALH